jgi:hypothetical protein
MPSGYDPDSFLNDRGRDEMRKVLEKSIYLRDFLWGYFVAKFNEIEHKIPEFIEKWKKDIFDVIDTIKNQNLRSGYRRDLKDRIFRFLNPKNCFHGDQNGIVSNHENSSYNSLTNFDTMVGRGGRLLREAFLLYSIVELPSLAPNVLEALVRLRFSIDRFDSLRDGIVDSFNMGNLESFIYELKHRENEDAWKDVAGAAGCFSSFILEKEESFVESMWNSVADRHMSNFYRDNDVKCAKLDCCRNLDDSNWQRLKALKVSFLESRRKII